MRSEGFEGQALRLGAEGNEGDQGIGAGADDGEVGGSFVGNEKHGGLGVGIGRSKAHGGGRRADGNGAGNAAIENVDGGDAVGGAIGDVHAAGVVGEDGGSGSGAEEHGVREFVSPGIDDLEAVRRGRNDVEFAAIGLEKHLRGSAGELEIGDGHGAGDIDDGQAILGAREDEGEGGIGSDEDFVWLGDDGNGREKLKSAGVVNGKNRGTAIDDQDIFRVGSDAGLYGVGIGVGAAVDLARGDVDGDELIGVGGGGVEAVAIGGEVDGKRTGADGDAGDLVGGRVEDEGAVAGRRDAPDFVACGVLAEIRDIEAEVEFVDRLKAGEVDGGDGAVGGGDVSVHVEVGAEEGGSMLAEEDNGGGDEKEDKREVDAEVSGMRHGMEEEYQISDIRYQDPRPTRPNRAWGTWYLFSAGGTPATRDGSVEVAVEDQGDLLDFAHECGVFGGEDGLDAVGEGFFWLVMDFDQEAVGAYGYRGSGERENFVALAGAVGRIDENGEVAAFFHGGDDGEIESVAGKIGEGADAAFAEHDVIVAFGEDVFGGHEEFVESGGHAALEENGGLGAASAFEEREILHVAGADLNDVGVFLDEVEGFVVDGFGDDTEAIFFANHGEDFEAGEAQPLEGVGRGARFVGAAAEEFDAGGLELFSNGEALLFGFDSAGTGDHGDMLAADEDVAGRSGDTDDGVFLLNVAGDELVGLGDGDALDDAGEGFKSAEIDSAGVAGDADGGAAGTGDGVSLETEGFDALADGADLLFGGIGLHDDEHGRRLSRYSGEGLV